MVTKLYAMIRIKSLFGKVWEKLFIIKGIQAPLNTQLIQLMTFIGSRSSKTQKSNYSIPLKMDKTSMQKCFIS